MKICLKSLKLLVLAGCLLITSLAHAQILRLEFLDLNQPEDKLLGYIYQQPFAMENDPVGDMLLLETVKFLPKSLMAQLTGKYEEKFGDRNEIYKNLNAKFPNHSKILQEELEYDFVDLTNIQENLRIAIEGYKQPFKLKKIKKMFSQVITEEFHNGIVPKFGKPHDWSDEFQVQAKGEYIIYKRFSKIFLCLVRGVCSRFIVSGKENELEKYILSQDYESITLDKMFRNAYRIAEGDVYLTLLTIENVLSRYWQVSGRENLAITKRLKAFTNYHYRTDIFGQWYHLFGIMLYGYVNNAFSATIVGKTESIGSLILSGFKPERQENAINALGGRIGAYIRRFVKRERYKEFEMNEKYLDEKYYRIIEDFSKKIENEKKKKAKHEKKN